jgi:hypothetical protein
MCHVHQELLGHVRASIYDRNFKDHPKTELSNRNLLFMVKLPIRWRKVVKTLIDNGIHSTS